LKPVSNSLLVTALIYFNTDELNYMSAPSLPLTNTIIKPAFCTLVSFIIAGSLICNHWFIAPSQTAFFFYTLLASLFIACCGLLVFIQRKNRSISLPSAPFVLLLFVLYVALHGLLINNNYNNTHVYVIISSLFFIALIVSSIILPDADEAVFIVIIAVAGIEAIICLLQYIHVLRSQNSYFAVTGTWINPNVTATFLAMSTAALLYRLFSSGRYKQAVRLVLALVIAALYLLKCRTAWVGTLVIITLITNYHFTIWQRFTSLQKRSSKLLIAFITITVLLIASIYAYQMKQASADSRLLVWKLSMRLMAQNPITGYGYGNFEQAYNLAQATWFKNGACTAQEKIQAGYVHMAYNEVLQNALEGGLPGLLLLMAVLVSLLWPAALLNKQRSLLSVTALAGLLAFLVMSLINFTIQAIPALCLFAIYATSYLRNTSQRKYPINKNTAGILLFIAGVYFLITQTQTAVAQRQNQQAAIAIKKGNYRQATQLLQPLAEKLKHSDTYWQNYGRLLFEQKQYHAATILFNKAKAYTADPNLYMATGYCYANEQQFANAEKEFELAAYIEPNRLTPRHALLQLYLKRNDSTAALQQAKAIAAMQEKVPSAKAAQFKKEADQIIKQLTPTFNNNISHSSIP
jgi:O-antigen polymerase